MEPSTRSTDLGVAFLSSQESRGLFCCFSLVLVGADRARLGWEDGPLPPTLMLETIRFLGDSTAVWGRGDVAGKARGENAVKDLGLVAVIEAELLLGRLSQEPPPPAAAVGVAALRVRVWVFMCSVHAASQVNFSPQIPQVKLSGSLGGVLGLGTLIWFCMEGQKEKVFKLRDTRSNTVKDNKGQTKLGDSGTELLPAVDEQSLVE